MPRLAGKTALIADAGTGIGRTTAIRFAGMALYLASDQSRMVTGQVLPVDSGVTIS